MENTYFKTAFKSALSNLIETSDDTNAVMPYNPYATWVFGKAAESLTSVNSDKVLVPKPVGGASYSSNSVKIQAPIGNYLGTGIPDEGDITVIGVAEVDKYIVRILAGNLEGSRLYELSHWGIFSSGSQTLASSVRGGGSGGNINNAGLVPTITTNKPFIYALSINKTTKSVVMYMKAQGVEDSFEKTFTANYQGTGSEIVFGNINYDASTSVYEGVTTHYEATIYRKALTLAQIKNAVTYMEQRSTERGVILS